MVTYHPGLPNIGGILRELHPLLHISNRCKQAIQDLPMMAFRRPKSLRDYLVRAKLRPLDRETLPAVEGFRVFPMSSMACAITVWI